MFRRRSEFVPLKIPVQTTRRHFVFATLASSLAARSAASATIDTFTPEMFGAAGDGRTNDTRAFAALSARVNARGGGTIVLRPVTYIVGEQRPSPGGSLPSFAPFDIIHLTACSGPITIKGNGARLRGASGLRFGRFDPASGRALPDSIKLDLTNKAAPYMAMIFIEQCRGAIDISDIELDGNLEDLLVGGRSFRAGWEAGATGLRLYGNTADEHLSHIHSHHHGVDGLILTRTRDQTGTTSVRNVTCEFNGRQGCSLTGGRDLTFEQCKFGRTGKAGLLAAPGDGLDIEAESSPIRNATFSDCEFSDNGGFGVGAGKTDAADIRFLRCKLIGTQNWAAWPYAPKLEFDDCLFVGAIIHAYGDPDQARAAKFIRSTFTDDPSLSPTGKVFIGRGGLRSIAVVRDGPNVLFDRCRFNLIGDALLPQTRPDTIFQSCIMSQRSAVISHPVGRYTGTCTIIGNANLAGSAIDGTVTLNGRRL